MNEGLWVVVVGNASLWGPFTLEQAQIMAASISHEHWSIRRLVIPAFAQERLEAATT